MFSTSCCSTVFFLTARFALSLKFILVLFLPREQWSACVWCCEDGPHERVSLLCELIYFLFCRTFQRVLCRLRLPFAATSFLNMVCENRNPGERLERSTWFQLRFCNFSPTRSEELTAGWDEKTAQPRQDLNQGLRRIQLSVLPSLLVKVRECELEWSRQERV